MAGSLFDFSALGVGVHTPADILRSGLAAAARPLTPDEPLEAERGALDFTPWLQHVTPNFNWQWRHLVFVRRYLEQVRAGTLKRLIIQLPPRHGKTEHATIRFPIWWLEQEPWLRVIVGAYNQILANKFSRKARRIAASRMALSKERTAVEDWETDEGGGIRAVGVGSGITGQGGNLVVIDDPVKSREEAESEAFRERVWDWYTEDLYTRLEPGGAIILQMTRWHEDDLAGRILASEDAPNWTVISLPAIAEDADPLGRAPGEALCPERFDVEALKGLAVVVGSRGWSSLYQQQPAPATGAIINTEFFRYYTTRAHPILGVPFIPDVLEMQMQSWDFSFKNLKDSDRIAGQAWGTSGADCYLLDAVALIADFMRSIDAVHDLTRKWPQALAKLVEDKANGPAIISALRNKIPGLIAIEPDGDKISRAWAITPLVEAGNVWLPHPSIAPWVAEFKLECARFPYGRYDDQVDAMTQILRRLAEHAAARLATKKLAQATTGQRESASVGRARY
jgi:predicted phage terminase large subunit-like protein